MQTIETETIRIEVDPMNAIFNFTQHLATPEQIEAGIVNFPEFVRELFIPLLNFEELPTAAEVSERATALVEILNNEFQDFIGEIRIMIGGAPFLMEPLSMELRAHGFVPVFAFSKRESIETIENGVCKKSSVFKHAGLVEMGN